jgi:hypothetical protein
MGVSDRYIKGEGDAGLRNPVLRTGECHGTPAYAAGVAIDQSRFRSSTQ